MSKFLLRTGDVLSTYHSRRAVRAFMRASEALLRSRLGRLALAAPSESDCNVFTRDEQRRLALAMLADAANRTGIDTEDCTLRALLELAMHRLWSGEQKQQATIRAIDSFYL